MGVGGSTRHRGVNDDVVCDRMVLCHSRLRFLECIFALGARLKLAACGLSTLFGLVAILVE